MIAVSVAEAALQPDPDSPSLEETTTMPSHSADEDSGVDGQYAGHSTGRRAALRGSGGSKRAVKGEKPLWDIVERAKERRERQKCKSCPIVHVHQC